MMRLSSCMLAAVTALSLLGCNKPTDEACRKAIGNMRTLMGTDNLRDNDGIEGEVRRCKGGSSKKSVECAIKATSLDELRACDFYKVPANAPGVGPMGSAAGSGSAMAGSAAGSGSAMTGSGSAMMGSDSAMAGSGSAAASGSGTGTATGSATGAGSAMGAGSATGTGSAAGAGAATGAGSATGTGSAAGSATGTGSGAGSAARGSAASTDVKAGADAELVGVGKIGTSGTGKGAPGYGP